MKNRGTVISFVALLVKSVFPALLGTAGDVPVVGVLSRKVPAFVKRLLCTRGTFYRPCMQQKDREASHVASK